MKAVDNILKWRTKGLGYFVMFIVAFMVLAVFWQVFTRLVMRSPAVWTEETSTYLLMWCGLVGASYAYGKGEHVGMEYFASKMNPLQLRILNIAIQLLVAYFAYRILLVGGINLVRSTFTHNQVSPTMNIPTGYLYLCLPISGFFMLTYCVEFFVMDIIKLSHRKVEK